MPFALDEYGESHLVNGHGYTYGGRYVGQPYNYGYSLTGRKYSREEYFHLLNVCPSAVLTW